MRTSMLWPSLLGVLLVAAAASRSSPKQHGGGVRMDTSTGQPPNFTSPHWPFDQCPPFPTPYAQDDYPVNYSYTGTFPKDFIWGLGTAAYQVCSFPRSLAPSLPGCGDRGLRRPDVDKRGCLCLVCGCQRFAQRTVDAGHGAIALITVVHGGTESCGAPRRNNSTSGPDRAWVGDGDGMSEAACL